MTREGQVGHAGKRIELRPFLLLSECPQLMRRTKLPRVMLGSMRRLIMAVELVIRRGLSRASALMVAVPWHPACIGSHCFTVACLISVESCEHLSGINGSAMIPTMNDA